jgi:PAS domain S-box-containing protein
LNRPDAPSFDGATSNPPNIEAGWGYSKSRKSFEAGKKAASAALRHIKQNNPSVVFVFASARYDLEQLLAGVVAVTGKVPLVGGTTAGEICDGVSSSGRAVVGIIASPYISVRAAVGRNVSRDWKKAIRSVTSSAEVNGFFSDQDRQTFQNLLRDGKTLFATLFSPGDTRTADSKSHEILEELKRLSGGRIPFFGGSTADDRGMEKNYVFCGDKVYRDGVVVAVFETQLQFGISMGHGFRPISSMATITKSRGHDVRELDHDKASEVFSRLQGFDVNYLAGKHLFSETRRPVGIHRGFGRYSLGVASRFTERGGVRLSQPVEAGESLAIMEMDEEATKSAARDSVLKAMDRADIRDPAVVLLSACALQSKISPGAVEGQIERLIEAVPRVSVGGFCSFGETGLSEDGVSRHSHASVSALVIDQHLSYAAQVALENHRLRLDVEARVRAKRRAEDQLEKHVAFMESVFDAMPNPVWHKDKEGLVTWCNRAFEEYFEVPRERFIGQCHDLHLEGECTGYCQLDSNIILTGGPMSYEWELRSPSGTSRHVVVNKVPIGEADGSVGGIVGVIADITAQKTAEEKVKRIEERWDLALMGSGDGVWDWDLRTDRVYLSPRWKEIIGYDDDEIGDSLEEWEKRVHPDDLAGVKDVLREHFEGKLTVYTTVHRMLCKDGAYRWVLDRGKITTRDESGAPLRMVGTHSDVTEQQKIKEASDRRSEEFRILLDTLPGLAFSKNDKGEYITGSQTFCDAVGLSREELAGKTDDDLFPPDLARKYQTDDSRIFGGETDLIEVEEEVTWEGGRIPVSTRKTAVKDRAGNVVGLIGLGFDISSLKTTERELRKFQRVIEHSPLSIVITNSDDLIEYVNPKLLDATGYTTQELIGKDPGILLAESVENVMTSLRAVIMAGGTWHGEVSSRKKNGDRFWEMASISPVLDEFGKIAGFVGIKEDITERKRVEESLRLTKVELEMLNRQLHTSMEGAKQLALEAQAANVTKSQFLANMSHELRTPMNGILGMVSFLLDSTLNEEQREFAQIIQSSARSLLSIINDILDISKVEAGKIGLDSIEFSPMRAVDEAIRTVSIMARSKGNSVASTISHDVPEILVGDPARLRQVLTNLLGNAVKFTNNGAITVGLYVEEIGREECKLKFCVSDTGIGIPADKVDCLFKAFSQVDSSISRRYGGTGLGLMIAKQLAIMMDGEIGVDSVEGEGSTFWFTALFSRRKKRRKRVSIPEPPLTVAPSHDSIPPGLRVLVAEDHPMNQIVAKKMLRNLGCEVFWAENGKKAVDMAGKGDFDIIFMDLQMPEMDGLEATSLIRKREEAHAKRHVPIVAMTAHAMEGDREACLQAGMDDYVSKPLEVDLVAAAIARCRFVETLVINNVTPSATSTIEEKAGAQSCSGVGMVTTSVTDIFDRERLLRTVGEDEEFLQELVGMFIKDMPGHVETLESMVDLGDSEGLTMMAHRLKGASANVRADHLKRLFADIEVAARQQNAEKARTLLSDFPRTFGEFTAVCNDVRRSGT